MPEQPARILIVADKSLESDGLADRLADWRHDVVLLRDGDDAVKVLTAAAAVVELVITARPTAGTAARYVLRHGDCLRTLRSIPVVVLPGCGHSGEPWAILDQGLVYVVADNADPGGLGPCLARIIRDRRELTALRLPRDPADASRGAVAPDQAFFLYRSLSAAREIAWMLADACPDPRRAAIGLTELMINAVEHGNLGITHAEKLALHATNAWEDEVQARLLQPRYADRRVFVRFARENDRIRVLIRDAGLGFDWRRYLTMDASRELDNSGRGIALARAVSFDVMEYRGRGNEVEATILTRGD